MLYQLKGILSMFLLMRLHILLYLTDRITRQANFAIKSPYENVENGAPQCALRNAQYMSPFIDLRIKSHCISFE